jgi:hypothetical protein
MQLISYVWYTVLPVPVTPIVKYELPKGKAKIEKKKTSRSL